MENAKNSDIVYETLKNRVDVEKLNAHWERVNDRSFDWEVEALNIICLDAEFDEALTSLRSGNSSDIRERLIDKFAPVGLIEGLENDIETSFMVAALQHAAANMLVFFYDHPEAEGFMSIHPKYLPFPAVYRVVKSVTDINREYAKREESK